MNIWHMLGTLISAIGLMEVLLGKEVTTPDGASLGVAADIKLDLIQDKIWMVVENQGRWSIIPSEQIASLTDKVILFMDWLPAYQG